MRAIVAAVGLAAVVSASWCAPTAHVRGAEGKWQQVEAKAADGKIAVTITPAQTDGGRAVLVINKPDWMVLDDDQPPELRISAVDGKAVEAAAGAEGIDLGCLARAPQTLTLEVSDDKNPIAAESLWVTQRGARLAIPPPEAPLERTVKLDLALPAGDLGPGRYDLTIGVSDAAPLQNEAVCPLSFSVFGAAVSDDQQQITLAGPGTEYVVRPNWNGTVEVVGVGSNCYLTVDCGGWRYIEQFESVEIVAEEDERKVIRARGRAYDREAEQFDDSAMIEYDFEVRRDTPALLVTSRVTNQGPEREVYCFWGWLAGAGFQLAGDDQPREWNNKEYVTLGLFDWLYLPSTQAGQPGLGVATPLVIGESRFGTMVFYTDPTRIETQQGDAVEMKLAIFPASSADEVAEVAAALPEQW